MITVTIALKDGSRQVYKNSGSMLAFDKAWTWSMTNHAGDLVKMEGTLTNEFMFANVLCGLEMSDQYTLSVSQT